MLFFLIMISSLSNDFLSVIIKLEWLRYLSERDVEKKNCNLDQLADQT